MASHRTVVGVLAVLAVGGCGGSAVAEADPTPTVAATSATPSTSPASTPSASTPPTPAAPTARLTVTDGKVAGPRSVRVEPGATVVLEVVSDRDDTVHVHGYDMSTGIRAGVPARIRFTASIPGQFEVELHHAGTPLCEVRVG